MWWRYREFWPFVFIWDTCYLQAQRPARSECSPSICGLTVTSASPVRCVLSPPFTEEAMRLRREGDSGLSPIQRLIFLRKVILAATQTPTGQDRAVTADSCLDPDLDEQEP